MDDVGGDQTVHSSQHQALKSHALPHVDDIIGRDRTRGSATAPSRRAHRSLVPSRPQQGTNRRGVSQVIRSFRNLLLLAIFGTVVLPPLPLFRSDTSPWTL